MYCFMHYVNAFFFCVARFSFSCNPDNVLQDNKAGLEEIIGHTYKKRHVSRDTVTLSGCGVHLI